MARDIFHPIVREVLLNDGWIITHDPYPIRVKGRNYEVDLGAEQLVAAEKGLTKIAVEPGRRSGQKLSIAIIPI